MLHQSDNILPTKKMYTNLANKSYNYFLQGYGRSLWLMHGMFRANGCCGYVKKPTILLKAGPDNEVFDPETALPTKTTLKVSKAL